MAAGLMAALLMLAACSDEGSPDGIPGLVSVGGRLLYLTCMGEGSPTVVLEAGGMGNSASWSPVQKDIATFTRVCAYDRAGEGFSSSVPAHTSMEAMDRDLRALLEAGGMDGPFVIVGHSFGGRLVRSFASLYPDDVVGMVLVDPGHEDFLARAQELLTTAEWNQYVKVAGGIASRMEAMQGSLVFDPSVDVPLVVVSASGYLDRPEVSNDADEKLHQLLVSLHRELVDGSPTGVHIMAEGSSHAIQDDRPELVIQAIRQVMNLARD